LATSQRCGTLLPDYKETNMRRFVIPLLILAAGAASAQVHVSGYTKKDGTYVAPHQRTAPNSTKADNYSTQGNVNPYTGKEGTVPNTTNSLYGAPQIQPLPALSQPAQPVPPQNIWAQPQTK
jgi:hypothetical protein